jgi:hypothetical protein
MKLTKIVSKECNSFAPVRKEWIATAIGAAASLASSLIGGHKAAQAAREAERKQKAREASENAWYLRRYNEDYADTAAGQNLMRKAKDFANSQWKKAEGAKAVGGGTDASAAMAKEAGNKMVGDTLANISAQDQSKKAQVDAMHRNAQDRFMQMDVNRELQRSQNITNAAQNASNAMMQAGAAVDGAKSQANTSTTSLTGGSNGGSSVLRGDSAYLNGSIGVKEGFYEGDVVDKMKHEITGL